MHFSRICKLELIEIMGLFPFYEAMLGTFLTGMTCSHQIERYFMANTEMNLSISSAALQQKT